MKFRAIVVPAVLIFALAGCAPEPIVSSPSPSPSESTPSASPSETPAGSQLTLPDDCDVLVPISVIHDEFYSGFESIYFAADLGDASAQSFAARNGLTCLWGIPQSDAGFITVFAAERGMDTDEEQAAAWKSAGYTECPPFLDVCYFEESTEETGEVWTAHVLVDGFELQIQASSTSLDPLLAVAREAATSMGYL
jgi:hypothetical protein